MVRMRGGRGVMLFVTLQSAAGGSRGVRVDAWCFACFLHYFNSGLQPVE